MDAMWIQVFVLTLSECVAPAGKTVCQQQEMEMQFLARAECEAALEQLIAIKDQLPNTIVNRTRSGCTPTARQAEVYASADAVKAASAGERWRDPAGAGGLAPSTVSHAERLSTLSSCEDSLGVAPCKLGDIIVEGASNGRPVEVWRSDR